MREIKLKNTEPREVIENILLLLFLPLLPLLMVVERAIESPSPLVLLALASLFGIGWALCFLYRLLKSIQTVSLSPEAIVIRSALGELARITPDSLVRVRVMDITVSAGRHSHVLRKLVLFCGTSYEEIRYHKNRRRGAGYWFITPTEENKQALLAYLRAHAPEVPFGISLM